MRVSAPTRRTSLISSDLAVRKAQPGGCLEHRPGLATHYVGCLINHKFVDEFLLEQMARQGQAQPQPARSLTPRPASSSRTSANIDFCAGSAERANLGTGALERPRVLASGTAHQCLSRQAEHGRPSRACAACCRERRAAAAQPLDLSSAQARRSATGRLRARCRFPS